MNEYVEIVIDFFAIFTIVFLLYHFFLNKKRRTYSEGKKADEIRLFITRYDLDMRKTDYKKVLLVVTLMNSFILAFVTTIVLRVDGILWSILYGFVIVCILTYALYEIVGRAFKRKEGKKDE